MKLKKIYLLKPTIFALLFGLTFTGLIQACKSNRAISKPVTSNVIIPVKNDIRQSPKKDTVPTKRRVLTEAEFQHFVQEQYQYNYNRFFLPEFRKITDENSSLKESIKTFAELFKIAKKQKDSIQRNEQRYKDQSFNFQKEILRLKQEEIRSKTENTATVAKFMEKTDSNLKLLNDLTRGMVIIGSLIGGGVLVLLIAVIILWNKVSLLRRKIDHA